MLTKKVLKLKQWISESDNIVFFGGAGVSTESGIPDFRSADGLYSKMNPPETILSPAFLWKTPEFIIFIRTKWFMIMSNQIYLSGRPRGEGKIKGSNYPEYWWTSSRGGK